MPQNALNSATIEAKPERSLNRVIVRILWAHFESLKMLDGFTAEDIAEMEAEQMPAGAGHGTSEGGGTQALGKKVEFKFDENSRESRKEAAAGICPVHHRELSLCKPGCRK